MTDSVDLGASSAEARALGNVLVIGNSGVGKSTLINAVLGEEVALASKGTAGTTQKLNIYGTCDSVPFRIIDTIGFEPSFWKRHTAIQAVKKWSRNSAKDGNENTQINVIWFCVDGTSSKLFPTTIHCLSQATKMWPSVPIIVVITKSYSVPERSENIDLVNQAFAEQKVSKSLRAVIPVVAETYTINDTAFAPPEGVSELIDKTNQLMPEGLKGAEHDVAHFKLMRKRALSHSVVATAAASGGVVGAVPLPFPDAAILGPVEIGMVGAIAKIYGIEKNEQSKAFFDQIIQVGTVGIAAKTAIKAIQAIPGINLAAAPVNAAIAAGLIVALGEGSTYAFEQVYLGNKSIEDLDWVRKVLESKLAGEFLEKMKTVLAQIPEGGGKVDIANILKSLFSSTAK